MPTIDQTISPVRLNDQNTIFDVAVIGAGSMEKFIALESESFLSSLFVDSISGDLDIKLYTQNKDGQYTDPIVEFPTITTASTRVLLRQPARTMRIVRVVATYTDDCTFNLSLRGVRAGAGSVTIESPTTFQASQKDITSTTEILVASALDNRKGILITHHSVSGADILYIGGTALEALTTVGTPIFPGGNLTIDLEAGAELYATSNGGTIDVRISQSG